MKYHTLFVRKFGEVLQNLSSAAVLIDALRFERNLINDSTYNILVNVYVDLLVLMRIAVLHRLDVVDIGVNTL